VQTFGTRVQAIYQLPFVQSVIQEAKECEEILQTAKVSVSATPRRRDTSCGPSLTPLLRSTACLCVCASQWAEDIVRKVLRGENPK